ncbi:energy transducer TonB [Pedobacter sp. Leaf194]|uniref:energy transducer TonB n=1 Tax=Pedobacter sp. Leaf194 TaxID=1736297 RepID=UPI0007034DD3|nr:energy transducer TonB [Pedobacter sp. Leaf194]KQS41386.1 hypothetical protein ASG14_02615 [Pedobacter sp. Leaf194]
MKKLMILLMLSAIMLAGSAESYAQKVYDFVSVDKTPQYPGGMAKFYQYLGANIKYPAEAKANKTSGKVFLSFIVEESGKLSNIQVIRGLSKETNAEAIRVLQASPKWNPGMVNGKPVQVKYNLSINFDANGSANSKKSALGNNKIKSPVFPGGQPKLFSYLAKTLKYPTIAKKNNVQGKVLISFVVEIDGSLSNIQVAKGLSKETDAEALRAVKNSPKWVPAFDESGKPFRAKCDLPVNFKLS